MKKINRIKKRCIGLVLVWIMLLLQTACSMVILDEPSYYEPKPEQGYYETVKEVSQEYPQSHLPIEGNSYYDLENVVLYLYLYEELPDNYITKSEARDLGWEGGSVEKYKKGAAIGGDRFGNREGLLPKEEGRTYTECDLDTNGEESRGAKRLVFSSDGLYYYTEDHYESFDEVTVTQSYEVLR